MQGYEDSEGFEKFTRRGKKKRFDDFEDGEKRREKGFKEKRRNQRRKKDANRWNEEY